MLTDLSNAVREWWRSRSALERLGIRALGTAAVVAMLIALFPKAVAATAGGAVLCLALNLLRYGFAADRQ